MAISVRYNPEKRCFEQFDPEAIVEQPIEEPKPEIKVVPPQKVGVGRPKGK